MEDTGNNSPRPTPPLRVRLADWWDRSSTLVVISLMAFIISAFRVGETRQRRDADRQSVADRQELHRRLTELEAVATSRSNQVRENAVGIAVIRRDVAWIRKHLEAK